MLAHTNMRRVRPVHVPHCTATRHAKAENHRVAIALKPSPDNLEKLFACALPGIVIFGKARKTRG